MRVSGLHVHETVEGVGVEGWDEGGVSEEPLSASVR